MGYSLNLDTAPKSDDHVYAAIKQAIATMQYGPGEFIREEQLARALGVSRTPVREAFRRLGAEGWLEIKRNQGVRVTTWSIQDVEEIFEARADRALPGRPCRCAYLRRGPDATQDVGVGDAARSAS